MPYAAAIATGKLPRVLLGQWRVLPRLRKIPDSVTEFTGFQIRWDPIAGTGSEPEPYRALGSASVRNVLLPSATSHIGSPRTLHLAKNGSTRAWINEYMPETHSPAPSEPGLETAEHPARSRHLVQHKEALGAEARSAGCPHPFPLSRNGSLAEIRRPARAEATTELRGKLNLFQLHSMLQRRELHPIARSHAVAPPQRLDKASSRAAIAQSRGSGAD